MQQGGSVVLQSNLDYERVERYNITISAMDSGSDTQLSGFTNLIINVLDVNDNSPEITTTQRVFDTPEVCIAIYV